MVTVVSTVERAVAVAVVVVTARALWTGGKWGGERAGGRGQGEVEKETSVSHFHPILGCHIFRKSLLRLGQRLGDSSVPLREFIHGGLRWEPGGGGEGFPPLPQQAGGRRRAETVLRPRSSPPGWTRPVQAWRGAGRDGCSRVGADTPPRAVVTGDACPSSLRGP